ncbi:MAG: sugar phosphate nucleotidyltransferase [Desulfobacter sp.]
MKALILAAGFGTRLAPYTGVLPKPLFTINNRTMLDLVIEKLLGCGCENIYINTHHLAGRIREMIRTHPEKHCLAEIHEPEILDTGGAIANLREALSDDDFLVINADILCDIDLEEVVKAHKSAHALATLVVHDFPRFNKLKVALPENENGKRGLGRIKHFGASPETGLAFTGIQVISPEIFDHVPETPVFSSIDLYKSLCPSGRIRAFRAGRVFWSDIGTPKAYRATSRLCLAGHIFDLPPSRFSEIDIVPLAGDGSDRLWFRAVHDDSSIVISDHGICIPLPEKPPHGMDTQPGALSQLTAFVAIGRHLNSAGIAVPKVLGHDRLSGQVALEDLGNIHLADLVLERQALKKNTPKAAHEEDPFILSLYQKTIDALIGFSQKGFQGFNEDWTCQTRTYSKPLILDLECRYFMDAFVNGYLGIDASWTTYEPVFSHIADNALAKGLTGLMHRDMQSRNIMICRDEIRFIDFQSARTGPFQYDLASLLIDPYVTLPDKTQAALLDYAVQRLGLSRTDEAEFRHSYAFCCLTRNLQILGAFGFLTRVKQKPRFESFIRPALNGLGQRLDAMNTSALEPLTSFVTRLLRSLP